ncbi:MAG: sigma-70 family RNA polymerase sigma factor [Oscillospiraceae bacterium]|nr:sigma-70 family RNA polymerase sigma factor [Oscillospiraceae bacterium]
MTDSEIIELYNQRDERAVAETQTAYGRYCEKIAHNILGDRQEAQDCVNETLMKAWESIPPARPRIFSAYLAAITRNNAILRYRRETAAKRGSSSVPLILDDFADVIPNGSSVEQTAEHREMLAEINRYLGSLPEVNRTIFALRFFCFEDIPDIADRLGLGKKAVSAILYRTKKQIRKHLEKEGYNL